MNWEAEPAVLRFFTRLLDREVARVKPDLVIVMGWYPLDAKSGVPLVYWGDATVGQRINKSPHWSGLSKRTARQAALVERQALVQMAGTLWASRWAADDARQRYGLSTTEVCPFAANLADPRQEPRTITPGPVKLLSVEIGRAHV